MVSFILQLIAQDLDRFITNATQKDLELVMDLDYSSNVLSWITNIRSNKDIRFSFVEGFPLQSTKYPAVAFVLENDGTNIAEQTFSADNEHFTNQDWVNYQHVMNSFKGANSNFMMRSWYSSRSIYISCHSSNKLETIWISKIIDYIIKLNNDFFQVNGLLNVSHAITDLRIRPELFPTEVFTRIIKFDCKFQFFTPLSDSTKADFESFTPTYILL